MRHKCKLGFSVLIISSCLVQIASAIERKNRELTSMEYITKGTTVPKGSALITFPLSNNIIIGDGGVEIVDNNGTSVGATVQKGGMQIVTRAGTAMNTKIQGGKQLVFEEKSVPDFTNMEKRSSAYDVTVSGTDGVVGQQNVYDGAWAWNTKVMQGGEQNLYMGSKKHGGGFAKNTTVSGNGRQHVLEEAMAINTTLGDSAVQVVYPGGIVDALKINNSASSWVHVGAELIGEIEVNDSGCLYLFAGDRTNHIKKEKISVGGRADEWLFGVGERDNTKKSQIYIEDLSGEGGTVNFTSIPYDPRHISLHVVRLSGSLNFNFNISATGDSSDYLFIENGTGNHKISVSDSGREITGPLSQNNSLVTEIPLITDRSPNGGANFTLANSAGTAIEAVDGGTFVYGLYKRERDAESSGGTTTWYLGMADGRSSSSEFPSLRISRKPKVTTFSVSSSTNVEKSTQSHRNTNATRKRNQAPKLRPPRHLREAQLSVSSENHEQQSIVSVDASSLGNQMILRSSNQDQSFT
ncbi:pertactin-like passenger domain-containing protein, partial [Bartonella refiksaydamii]|uniref:pertactin-like passenger domain-containing protein n=1 Tax=Bartonella refiksaydamii TaxID=2654951 RepID=UPI0027380EB3